MPYPFTLPTAADVRNATGLQPEQVSIEIPDMDSLETEVEGRIEKKADLTLGKLSRSASPYGWPFSDAVMQTAYPTYSDEQIEAERDVQAANLTEYVSLLTQDSLFRSARQWEQAEAVRAEAVELWGAITESIAFVTSKQPADAPSGGVAVWTITTGDNCVSDEYASCN